MRCAWRNKRPFWYATYKQKTQLSSVDEWGNTVVSGESKLLYESPVSCKANISPNTGTASIRPYGTNEEYDRVLTIEDPDFPVTENSILWLDSEPVISTAGVQCGDNIYSGYDFIVKRVSRYLNSTVVLVTKVSAS